MHKRVQLFILPYAGGSTAALKRLTDLIDEKIETITVEYPGRGTRAKEPFADSIESLIADAISYCKSRREKSVPYAIMGYSMGSVLAYEIVARGSLVGTLQHLFIGAQISPKERSEKFGRIVDPSEGQIIEIAMRFGGLDKRMLENKRFFDIYIKPMISDYRLFFDYRFREHREKTRVDTTFFYCERDTRVTDVEKWIELLEGRFEYYEMGENHFFINSCYDRIADIINKTLCAEEGKTHDF